LIITEYNHVSGSVSQFINSNCFLTTRLLKETKYESETNTTPNQFELHRTPLYTDRTYTQVIDRASRRFQLCATLESRLIETSGFSFQDFEMGTAGGIAIGGANMWALLLDKDPGDRAAATDLASDVVDRKHKKAAVAVAVKVEVPPPAGKIAKPAKRGNNGKKMENGTARNSKQAPARKVKKTNGDAGHNRQADGEELTDKWIRRYLSQEGTSKGEEETMFTVVAAGGGGRRRTVAPRTRKAAVTGGATVTGANMWALLGDQDPGHSATTMVDAVKEAPQADNMDGSILVGLDGGVNPMKRGKKTKTTKKKAEMPAAPMTEFRQGCDRRQPRPEGGLVCILGEHRDSALGLLTRELQYLNMSVVMTLGGSLFIELHLFPWKYNCT
jgi:hypothetical protein